jgi:hypothetical protein
MSEIGDFLDDLEGKKKTTTEQETEQQQTTEQETTEKDETETIEQKTTEQETMEQKTTEQKTTEETTEEKVTVPEKFKDKGLNDVLKSYMELEKEKGRISNELGNIRAQMELLKAKDSDTQKQKEQEQATTAYKTRIEETIENIAKDIYDGNVKEGLMKLINTVDSHYSTVAQNYEDKLKSANEAIEKMSTSIQAEKLMANFYEKYPDLKNKTTEMEFVGMKLKKAGLEKYIENNQFNYDKYWADLASGVNELVPVVVSKTKTKKTVKGVPDNTTTRNKTAVDREKENTIAEEIESMAELW